MESENIQSAVAILAISLVLELFLYFVPVFWKYRRIVASSSFLILWFGAGMLAVVLWLPISLVLLTVSLYRSVTLLKLARDRVNEKYLRRTCLVSFAWLGGLQLTLAGFLVFFTNTAIAGSYETILGPLMWLSAFLAVVTLAAIFINLHDTLTTGSSKFYSDNELPTVTIAIPARNETDSLNSCLEAVLQSDYPKLEILVLDDCSQDKTAMVIKSFAHDGVRFVLGKVADDDWLAKNYSYAQLQAEATGKYILFMGVDVRLHESSVRELVQTLLSNEIKMLSVLPKRTKSGNLAAFVQPMRYWWQLSIPVFARKWPPVLSTCWVVDRKSLEKIGGFSSVRRAILPERHFAKAFKDAYKFMRTSGAAEITTHKDLASQWLTAIRTRYPQLHRRPEVAMVQSIALGIFLILPFFIVFTPLNLHIKIASLISIICFSIGAGLIALTTNKSTVGLALLTFWLVAIIDLIALNISMYRYEFGEVLWKGRNVCIPVMQAIPKLPDFK